MQCNLLLCSINTWYENYGWLESPWSLQYLEVCRGDNQAAGWLHFCSTNQTAAGVMKCAYRVPLWWTQVHYDCTFRGIDAVSSRAARLLGGNRIIAEVGK
eukprot:1141918-Pelagomonas_calceolata.AAC.4